MSRTYDIEDMLTAVQGSFRSVRSLILDNAGKADYTVKPDGSPVTAIDVQVETVITEALTEQFPGLLVFGEESGYGETLPEICWLLDPVDGTASFIENVPTFTCMAVCIENEMAVAAVIYNPSTDDMYTAQKGKGAFKNGSTIDLKVIALPTVAATKQWSVDALDELLRPSGVHCVEAPSGVGFAFTQILDGRSAARFTMLAGGYTHDYAPGNLLVQEAGGSVIPILDDVYAYTTKSFVACHPALTLLLTDKRGELRALELAASKTSA